MYKYLLLLIGVIILGAGCGQKTSDPLVLPNIPSVINEQAPDNLDWQIYANDIYGFEFKYPPTAMVEHYALSSSFNLLSLNLGVTARADYAPKASLEVFVIDKQSKNENHYHLSDGCYDELNGQVSIERLTLAGLPACQTHGQDAGAGNYYDSYWHTVPLEDKYLILAYTIHTVNCSNVGDGKSCVEFDAERDTELLKDILATMKIYDGEGQGTGQYSFEDGQFFRKLHYYSVDFSYPVMQGSAPATRNFINQTIQDYLATTTGGFIDYATPINDDGRPGPYALQNEYNVTLATADLLSLVFNGYTYSGGAHGISTHQTYIFDLHDNRIMSLSDLFNPGTDYLEVLSDFCEQELIGREISEADWVRAGASPKTENYAYYFLTDQGLSIIFPAYQVASYAAGPQEVLIPYDKLKGILKSDLLDRVTLKK